MNNIIYSKDDIISQDNYLGYILSAPKSFWEIYKSNPKLIDEVTNGCGTKGLVDYFVPDKLWGLSILAACKIHDWTYIYWDDKEGFTLSNTMFRNNIQRIIIQHYNKSKKNFIDRFLRDRRMKLSIVYYEAVEYFGERAYYDT